MIGLGVGPAGALDRFPGPWHHDGAGQAATGDDDHGGRDDASCDAPAPTVPTSAAAPAAGSVSQTVTVVVPPIVRVRSDAQGRLTVVTNAARPPAAGDQVYLLQPDGDYAPADQALVARVMTSTWSGGSWCSTTAEHRSADAAGHDDQDHED